jgi:hypothetical protein
MATERDIILEQLNNNTPIYFKSFKPDNLDMNLEINDNKIELSYVTNNNSHIKTQILDNNKIGNLISRVDNDKKILVKFTIIEYSVLCIVKCKYNFIGEIIFNNNSKEEMSTFKMSVYSINKMGIYACNYFLENTYYSTC